jgi:hypothetical protein
MFVTRFCSVIPNRPLGLQDDLEQLEASAGLLALMDSLPPAASPVDNLLEAVAAAQEAERIAARWDEKARQKAKFTYESQDGEDFLNRMSLAFTVHDAPQQEGFLLSSFLIYGFLLLNKIKYKDVRKRKRPLFCMTRCMDHK